MNTDYETLRNEAEVKQLDNETSIRSDTGTSVKSDTGKSVRSDTGTSVRSSEHKLNSQYIAPLTSTQSIGNDNSAYEQANSSLCTIKSDSDHDYEHSTETTHVYKYLANSGGQYDTLQDLSTGNIPAINSNDWDNVYYGIEDGSYSSIDGAYGNPSCNADKCNNKNNEDNILTRYTASFK